MKFINHMKLDPDEIVSVEDIAPPSEDGTVVLTSGSSVQWSTVIVFSGEPLGFWGYKSFYIMCQHPWSSSRFSTLLLKLIA